MVDNGEPDNRRKTFSKSALSFDALRESIKTLYGRSAKGISWTDEDGDKISVKTDEDVKSAVRTSRGRTLFVTLA